MKTKLFQTNVTTQGGKSYRAIFSLKTIIVLFALFLVTLGTSNKLYAQRHLDINNTTACTYSVDIEWTDGGTNCQTIGVSVPAMISWTELNPYSSGTAAWVTVTDNTCGNVATIGSCPTSCGYTCLPAGYIYNCTGCGTPVNFFFTDSIPLITNAILDID